jgi:flavin-dependent dehydrogenase
MSASDLPIRCDVAVIGSGPGGSLAATLLARRGYDVAVFDKARHPRYVVGESLIPQFWRYCELAGVDQAIADEGFVTKAGGTVIWHGAIRQLSFKDFGYKRPALHVERDRFDQLLLEHARKTGAKIHEEVAVLDVDLGAAETSGPSLTCRVLGESSAVTVSCRYVIDASGQSSLLSRKLGLRVTDSDFRFMSMWGYFSDSKYVALDGAAHPFSQIRDVPPTTFVTSVQQFGEWGWLWHIPLRQDTSVGFVLPVEQLKGYGRDGLEALFLETCHKTPVLSQLLAEARYREGSFRVVRDFSYWSTQLTGPGYFLVGDAAAFVDPIFSQGVPVAMYSGCLAAEAVHLCLKRPEGAAAIQKLYGDQVSGRIEVGRSLALPRYETSGGVSSRVQDSIRYFSRDERELMFVASSLTNRSANLRDMNQGEDVISSDKLRTLDAIRF